MTTATGADFWGEHGYLPDGADGTTGVPERAAPAPTRWERGALDDLRAARSRLERAWARLARTGAPQEGAGFGDFEAALDAYLAASRRLGA